MKKLILVAIFACTALLGCMHAGGPAKDTSHGQPVSDQKMNGQCILDIRWKLVELWGKPVAGVERFLFIRLHGAEGFVSGYGGCNSIRGGYELKPGNRIRFTNMASTMMACPDMELEQEFFKVLNMADNFACDGKTLFLHQARMAPLARFEAVD